MAKVWDQGVVNSPVANSVELFQGVCKNQVHLIWIQNCSIPHIRTPKQGPPFLETHVLYTMGR